MCAAATLAWGAGAFGAIYSWGYVPLLAASALLGGTGLLFGRGPIPWPIISALALVGVAVAAQLIPLSAAMLADLSPRALDIYRQRDLATAVGTRTSFPISIDPRQTLLSLLMLGVFTLLLAGTARMLTRQSARQLAAALCLVGVALAIAGLVQRATFNGKLYGFWELTQGGRPFGPYVNRNHFAGWMLMVLPLAAGLLASVLVRSRAGVRPHWRDRLLWLASPDANKAILIGFAVLTMALALVVTLSRSGITTMIAAMLCVSVMTAVRRSAGRSRFVIPLYLAAVTLAVVSLVGVDLIAARFVVDGVSDGEGRRAIWSDTWRMVNDFSLTGTGLNTFGSAALFYQTTLKGSHMREAHNDYLQLAAEGGLLAGLPIVVAIAVLAYGIRKRFCGDVGSIWWIRAGAVTGLLAVAAQSVVEFSLQMPGNAALFAVLCGVALHDGGRAVTRQRPDAAPVAPAEPGPPARQQSSKVVRFSAAERPLEFASDGAHEPAGAPSREFEPSDLDDPAVPLTPAHRRMARLGPARSNRPASTEKQTLGIMAILTLMFLLLVFVGLFGG